MTKPENRAETLRAKPDRARAGRRRAPEALRREAAAFAKAEHAAGQSYSSEPLRRARSARPSPTSASTGTDSESS
jgi:hypothetical protein